MLSWIRTRILGVFPNVHSQIEAEGDFYGFRIERNPGFGRLPTPDGRMPAGERNP